MCLHLMIAFQVLKLFPGEALHDNDYAAIFLATGLYHAICLLTGWHSSKRAGR